MNIILQVLKIALIFGLALFMAEQAMLKSAITKIFIHTAVMCYIVYKVSHIFLHYVVRNVQLKSGLKNLLLCGYTFVICIWFGELIFSFAPRAHGAHTLSTQNWFSYFWKNNTLGYRDKPYEKKDTMKKKIFFLGDSFTAGHGIPWVDHRFSNIVGEKLKHKYEFYNLGINGASTKREYIELRSHPMTADILIWQYVGNDINPTVLDSGKSPLVYSPFSDINAIQESFVRGSYLLNYLYWKFPKQSQNLDNDYTTYFIEAYQDTVLWNTHLKQIDKIIQYSKHRKIPLLVIIFPFLDELKKSGIYVSPLIDYLKANHIPVLDVTEIAKKLEFEERIINLHNLHPSVELNQLVAQAICQKLINENIITPQ